MRAVKGLLVLVLATLTLGSCAARGVSIPPGFDDLPACDKRTINVENLINNDGPKCNLEGSVIVFPDGYSLGIGEVGAVQGHQYVPQDEDLGSEYLIVNWGIPGVGVSKIVPGERTISWASSAAALELQEQQLRLK